MTPGERDAVGSVCRILLKYAKGGQGARCSQVLRYLAAAESKPSPVRQTAGPFRTWYPSSPRGVYAKGEWRKMTA